MSKGGGEVGLRGGETELRSEDFEALFNALDKTAAERSGATEPETTAGDASLDAERESARRLRAMFSSSLRLSPSGEVPRAGGALVDKRPSETRVGTRGGLVGVDCMAAWEVLLCFGFETWDLPYIQGLDPEILPK
jgi:hypothetical protein